MNPVLLFFWQRRTPESAPAAGGNRSFPGRSREPEAERKKASVVKTDAFLFTVRLALNKTFQALIKQPAQTRRTRGARDKSAYRCFLPDLTGFAAARRAGPDSQRHLFKADPTRPARGRSMDPTIAD